MSAPRIPRPKPIESPDWSAVKETVIEGVKRMCAEKYEDEDFAQYVYEAAMEAVYGPGYFTWRNSKDW